MSSQLNSELIRVASKPLTSRELSKLARYEKEIKIDSGRAEDFFIGNSSNKTIKAALRDHKPFQLWPDQVLSFNRGDNFGVNVAAIAHHVEAEILAQVCMPKFVALAEGRITEFELKDQLQHAGYMGVGGKSEVPEEVYAMFAAQKINELVTAELVAMTSAKRPGAGFSITRWGSDEDDWD